MSGMERWIYVAGAILAAAWWLSVGVFHVLVAGAWIVVGVMAAILEWLAPTRMEQRVHQLNRMTAQLNREVNGTLAALDDFVGSDAPRRTRQRPKKARSRPQDRRNPKNRVLSQGLGRGPVPVVFTPQKKRSAGG